MFFRWFFGFREKLFGVFVELVEYLEFRRRFRFISQFIVQLLTGVVGGDEKLVALKFNIIFFVKGEDSGLVSEIVLVGVFCFLGYFSYCVVFGNLDGLNIVRKFKENVSQDIRFFKKFNLFFVVMFSMENEKRVRSEGQRIANWKGGGQVGSSGRAFFFKEVSRIMVLFRNSVDSYWGTFVKIRVNGEGRDFEIDRVFQGIFIFLRFVFWKKENKNYDRVEVVFQVFLVFLVSGRLSWVVDELVQGWFSFFRILGGSVSRFERDVRLAFSFFYFFRKVGRFSRGSIFGML